PSIRSASPSPCCGGIFDWDRALLRLEELNAQAGDPSLWEDAAAAQKLMRERTHLSDAIEGYRALERELEDALTLIELGEAENDPGSIAEAERALAALKERAAKRELESLLSGEAGANDCYVEVHAGAGGTEAQDWAQMLLRMYMRWAE